MGELQQSTIPNGQSNANIAEQIAALAAATAAAAKTAPTVGRTPYDFGAELIQVLGRLTPLFVLVGMFLYTLVQVSQSYQAAQVTAMQQHASSVEGLNKLLTSSFAELDKVRKSQLENLEKITALGGTVSDAMTKSQEAVSKAREQVFEAQKVRQENTFAMEKAQREREQLEAVISDLQRQTWVAESTIDVAERLVSILSENRELTRDIRYLARRYEGAKSGMARDRDGKTFFGLYRIPGDQISKFIQSLQPVYPDLAARLEDAGGQEAAIKGDEKFRKEWRSISQQRGFDAAQHQFVVKNYYAHFLTQLQRVLPSRDGSPTFDPSSHSVALQAVLLSVAVQHGENDTKVVPRAFDGIDLATADDATLIKAIYAERRKTEEHFKQESDLVKQLLAVRYQYEEQEALKMLELKGASQ